MATRNQAKRTAKKHVDRKQNVSGRARVAAKQQGGQIHDLDNDVEGIVSPALQEVIDNGLVKGMGYLRTNGGVTEDTKDRFRQVVDKLVLTPVEQALENWKARQVNVPWWWLSFSRQDKHCGVVIVQGWNFADAVNKSNQLGVSPLKAAIYGEELSDLWAPKEGDQGKWVNRLLSKVESDKVFGEVVKVTEQSLYNTGKGEVKFK